MKNLIIFFLFITSFSLSAQNDNSLLRTIQVSGSAEMEIEPDELVLIVGIREYFEEEFEENMKPEDYQTKVQLQQIENDFIAQLEKAGIDKDNVRARNVGNYWRQQGQEFLFSKQLEIELQDFTKINELIDLLDARGVQNMNIGELRNSKMDEYENQVKTEALKNARLKAEVMVESLGEELGEVISISEQSNGIVRPMYANEMMVRSAEGADSRIDQIRNINLEYQVQATFRIK